MKILILSDINSAHTQKWAIGLSEKGIHVGIFSLSTPVVDWYSAHNITSFFSKGATKRVKGNTITKIFYLKDVPALKSVIRTFQPDILHAHYASSYGLLGALSKFHPFVISAWGSDVMEFPNRSLFHKAILKYNFNKADSILATSEAIVDSIKKISDKQTVKIPFGIDTSIFKPLRVQNIFHENNIVIGTVKSLEDIYGIDILLAAFKIVSDRNNPKNFKLLIVGGGSKEKEYKDLATQLKISEDVIFTGKVDYTKVVEYHNMIDIFVNVSRNESFGVAVLESSSCEKAVIVSSVGGLGEVIINNQTGLLVEKENINETANAIEKLCDEALRTSFGKQGRTFVKEKYDFQINLVQTINVYKSLIKAN